MKRVSQLAYCCGGKYWRWRLPNRPFPQGHTHCCDCGAALQWKDSPAIARASARRYYQRRRDAFYERGLTSRGLPRHRRFYGNVSRIGRLTPDQARADAERSRQLAKYHLRAGAFMASGFTSRGTPRRINRLNAPARPLEQAWRAFRSTIQIPCNELLGPLDRSES